MKTFSELIFAFFMKNEIITIEHHQIDMRYLHTRIYDKKLVEQLRQSIKTYSQLQPVYVVKDKDDSSHFILIDGYLSSCFSV